MAWQLVAALGASALSSLYGSNKAAKAQEGAANKAANTQRYMFDTARSDQMPWRTIGMQALNQQAQMLGLPGFTTADVSDKIARRDQLKAQLAQVQSNPGNLIKGGLSGLGKNIGAYNSLQNQIAQLDQEISNPGITAGTMAGKPDLSMLSQTPGYQFALSEGMRGVEGEMARRGLGGSGAELKALSRFTTGLADQTFNNRLNQLAALAGTGQTAATNMANQGMNYGTNLANLQMQQGAMDYNRNINQGNILSNTAGQIGSLYAMNNFNQPAMAAPAVSSPGQRFAIYD